MKRHFRIWLLAAMLLQVCCNSDALPTLMPGEVGPIDYAVHASAATIEGHPSDSKHGTFSIPDFSSIASFPSSSVSAPSNPVLNPSHALKDVTEMLNKQDTQTIIQNNILQPLSQITQQLTGDAGDASSSPNGGISSFNAQQFLVPFGIQIPSLTTVIDSNNFSPPTGAPSPPISPSPTTSAPPPPGSPPSSSSDSTSDSMDLRDGDLTPSEPEPTSCGSKEFECQMLKACYGCYKNISLPQCASCLLLKHCDKPDLPCQMQKSCRVCQAIRGKQQFYEPKLCGILHC